MMLDLELIRKKTFFVKNGVEKKGGDPKIVDKFLELDEKRKKVLKEVEELRRERNKLGKLIEKGKKKEILKKAKEIKEKLEEKENLLKEIEKNWFECYCQIPNLPFKDVPVGRDEKENIVLREIGEKPKFNFQPKNYLEIGEKFDLIDVKRSANTSGTRFGFLKNELILLQFAIINFTFETLLKENFVPILPPVLIKPELFWGMGYLEKGREDIYFIEKDNLYLIGTAEHIIGPMHANEIFEEKELPKRYLGYSTCFRREAGSWGKDTKGIFRVHQFDKIEMFSFVKPEDSQKEHDFFLEMEERLMKALKLPYRVVKVCSGDMAFPTARQFDIETWIPSENRYRETHSTSNCTDFQARRLNIKYRDSKTKKLKFLHTINGTAFALGRILISILENYQQKDGSVLVPEVLQKYLPFKKIQCQ